MSRRWRTLRYGASIGLTLVGVACGALLSGTLGGTLATGFIGIGLVGVVSLVFYEIGLSEDHERQSRRRVSTPPTQHKGGADPRPRPRPRRPDRMRGQRRRLR